MRPREVHGEIGTRDISDQRDTYPSREDNEVRITSQGRKQQVKSCFK